MPSIVRNVLTEIFGQNITCEDEPPRVVAAKTLKNIQSADQLEDFLREGVMMRGKSLTSFSSINQIFRIQSPQCAQNIWRVYSARRIPDNSVTIYEAWRFADFSGTDYKCIKCRFAKRSFCVVVFDHLFLLLKLAYGIIQKLIRLIAKSRQ